MCIEILEMIRENDRIEYNNTYNKLRDLLRSAFLNYRSAPPDEKKLLWNLLEKHKQQSFSAEEQRRHNSFVLMYLTEQKLSPKEIAQIQQIQERTFWIDLNHVLDDLMVLAFGISGIKPGSFHSATRKARDTGKEHS